MTKPIRTFSLDTLYYKFKSKGITRSNFDMFVTKMYEARFIDVFQDPMIPGIERFTELEKLTSFQNKDELFKLIQSIKEYSK